MGMRSDLPPGTAGPPPQAGVLRRVRLNHDAGAPVDAAAGAGPFHAYDGDGGYLGSFFAPFAAHEWTHRHAEEPGTRLPVEIDDRAAGWTHQVWPGHCQLLLWSRPICIDTTAQHRRRLILVPSGARA